MASLVGELLADGLQGGVDRPALPDHRVEVLRDPCGGQVVDQVARKTPVDTPSGTLPLVS